MKESISRTYRGFTAAAFPWLVAVLALTALVSENGAQPLAAILFLLSLPLFLLPEVTPRKQESVDKSWLVALMLPIVVSIPLFINSGTGEALAAGARYLLAGITLLALIHIKLGIALFLRAASASGMLAIILRINQFDQMRVDWGAGYLDSAYIGLLLLCLSLAQFHYDIKRPVWRLFAFLGIVCLVVTTVKTGSRGAWPAMLLVFCMQFAMVNIPRSKKMLIALVGVVLVGVSVFSIPSVKERIDLTAHEVKTYYENGNRASSMGYRLDFWHIAMNCFRENPLLGVDYQRRAELMEEYVEKYPQSRSIGNDGRSSSHNEFLNAMAKRGLLGVIGVLLLYLVPLRYFSRKLQSLSDPAARGLAMAGGSCVLVMMVCGLTEAPLMNVRVGTTYGFLLVVIYCLMEQLRNPPAIRQIE